ncbi:FxsA family protein [Amphritea pacifica]|uniref:Membrane protein FxsA n=1 Tax=Amphritea pacifica TaxID=2811233 RepID=A0ABS2WDK0_9GAMM|nr:FxsA family protein [Amphritea pacifica]MBN0989794.1 membrane protein FxsA [Amphritea pacifica]MBN1007797.1 membrane protein FxsA [Amphritea pacifica]
MRFLLLLFIIIPVIEITVLINVGQAIGAWYTVGLVLLSAFIGVNMLRYQGLSTLARAQQRMNAGQIPGNEMVEGIVLAVGGALLLTPGFVTDVIGFLCLIPYTRKALARQVMSRFTVVAMSHRQNGVAPEDVINHGQHSHRSQDTDRNGDIIDGDFRRED